MWLAHVTRWSPRRMVALWIGGIVLQVALIGGPLWWAVSHADEGRAAVQAVQQRWDIAERSDSLSVAAQRANETARLGASADGPLGIVRVPSMRQSIAARGPVAPSPLARMLSALWLYGIPVSLVLLTALWWYRRPARPATA